MSASTLEAPADVRAVIGQDVRLVAADGVELAGTWFLPPSAPKNPVAAVVIVGGGGIPARRYHRFARFLAMKGFGVLTFDYRGIGKSRNGSLRGFVAGTEHWGFLDFGAALAAARAAFPAQSLQVVAHSIGGLLVGAAPDAPRLTRMVFFGPHTGYCGDYRLRWRWLLFGVWHVIMPAVTRIVGYFPGRALRLGEDLPRQFALDWSSRRQPSFVAKPADRSRFASILGRYNRVRAETLVLSVTDDAFAPPRAGKRLLESYPSVTATHEIISPRTLGARRLGHFIFLQRNNSALIWERAAAWLLPASPSGRAGEPVASRSGVPPSGTKGDAFVGSATP